MYLDCFSEKRVSFAPSCHISDAEQQPGSNAVWMGMYAPVTQMRAAVKVVSSTVGDNRALLVQLQPTV